MMGEQNACCATRQEIEGCEPKRSLPIPSAEAHILARKNYGSQDQESAASGNSQHGDRASATCASLRCPIGRLGPGRDHLKMNRLAVVRRSTDVDGRGIAFKRAFPITLPIERLVRQPFCRRVREPGQIEPGLLKYFLPVWLGSRR